MNLSFAKRKKKSAIEIKFMFNYCMQAILNS